MIDYTTIHKDTANEVLHRFLRYTRIFTTSDESNAREHTPSTACQWELIRVLEQELIALNIHDISVDKHGYLIARLPGNQPNTVDTIGFMAHVDTNSDAPGEGVNPIVHDAYDGNIITLKEGIVLSPDEFPLLQQYTGQTLITSDGTTLLGADDKAGIAEILTAVSWMQTHPEFPRGDVEIIFTPDEETGLGMNRFPVSALRSRFCFTLDGGEEGELETECYYAHKAEITFTGRLIHPGVARGKMVNAVTMAGVYISMLPRNESPEATNERYGNYWSHKIEGGLERTYLTILFRSFDSHDIHRRKEALKSFGKAVESAFPGGTVEINMEEQYRNMREEINKHPHIIACLRQAYHASSIQPIERPIRGGTDGSKLTAMGIPTPNIFTGGQNFHSRSEWIALPAMTRAVTVVLNLIATWRKG